MALLKLLRTSGHSINISRGPANLLKDPTFTFSNKMSSLSGKTKTTKRVVHSFSVSNGPNVTDFGKIYCSVMLYHQENKLAISLAWELRSVKIKQLKSIFGSTIPHQQNCKSTESGFWKELTSKRPYHSNSFNSTRTNERTWKRAFSFLILPSKWTERLKMHWLSVDIFIVFVYFIVVYYDSF